MNIFENFIPHGTITCHDKDPPRMNKQIKMVAAEKNALYKRLKRKMLSCKLLDKLDALQAKLQSSINFFNLYSTNYSTIEKSQKNYLIHPLVLNATGLY